MDREDVLTLLTTSLDPDMPILQRKLPRAKNGSGGRSTNLTQGVWFEFVFELNEKNALMGNYGKILSDRVILANWVKEYEGIGVNTHTGLQIGGGITSGKITIGMYRIRCRNAKLYDYQPKPFLMPFRYCRQGYPCKDKTKAVIPLSVDECRELCMQYKVADPRFFNPQEIADIKAYAEKNNERQWWGIPSKTQWKELNEAVPGGIYGRYRIYNETYSEDWSPLTW
jgi:hypothetical protein